MPSKKKAHQQRSCLHRCLRQAYISTTVATDSCGGKLIVGCTLLWMLFVAIETVVWVISSEKGGLRGNSEKFEELGVFAVQNTHNDFSTVYMTHGGMFTSRTGVPPRQANLCGENVDNLEVCWSVLRSSDPNVELLESWVPFCGKKEKEEEEDRYVPGKWIRAIELDHCSNDPLPHVRGVLQTVQHEEAILFRKLITLFGDEGVAYLPGALNVLLRSARVLSTDSSIFRIRREARAPDLKGIVIAGTVAPLSMESKTWMPDLASLWPPRILTDCVPSYIASKPENYPIHADLALQPAPDGSLGLKQLQNDFSSPFPVEQPIVLGNLSNSRHLTRIALYPGDLLYQKSAFALRPTFLPTGWLNTTLLLSNISNSCRQSQDLVFSIALQLSNIGIFGLTTSPTTASTTRIPQPLSTPKLESTYETCLEDMDLWWSKYKLSHHGKQSACKLTHQPWHP